MSANQTPDPAWGGYYPSAAYGPPPQASTTGGGASWVAILGAFLATVGAGVATAIQAMAGILGLAYDSPLPDPTPTNEFFGVVFIVLYLSTFLSALFTGVALILSIVAATRQSAKTTLWVYVIFVVVCILCVGTWAAGLASIPG